MGLAHLLYLAYDKSRGGHFCRCERVLDKTQWMRRDELRELQVRKVKALLRHAYENIARALSYFICASSRLVGGSFSCVDQDCQRCCQHDC
jgi:hypothetical protein